MNPPPEVIAYQMAHKDDNKGPQLVAVSAIFGSLALSCVMARIVSRKISTAPFGTDDYLIIVAMICGIVLVITTCLMGTYGVGRHLLTISADDFVKFGRVNAALQTAYPFTIAFARLSILALYHRLFSKVSRIFAYTVWACVAYNVCWLIGVVLVVYLECHPVSTLWTGQCIPPFRTTLSTSVTNIIGDAMVLILPQPMLWKLKLSVGRKLGISTIMMLGLFTVVISIARIFLIRDGGNKGATDVTYTALNTYIFTILEPMVAIICACLPVMPTVLRYAFSSIRGLSILQSLSRSGGSKSELANSDSGSSKSLNNQYLKMGDMSHASHTEVKAVEPLSATPSLRGGQIWVNKQSDVDVKTAGGMV